MKETVSNFNYRTYSKIVVSVRNFRVTKSGLVVIIILQVFAGRSFIVKTLEKSTPSWKWKENIGVIKFSERKLMN